MFAPYCHCISGHFGFTPCSFADSMRWAAAYIVECELQESQQARFTEPDDDQDPSHMEVKPHKYVG